MNRIPIWVLLISSIFLFHGSDSVEDTVKSSLINFLVKLSSSNGQAGQILGWNMSTDPCKDNWLGVGCDRRNLTVRKLYLDGLRLAGTLDATSLCTSQSLVSSLIVLSINNNNVTGGIPPDIANCKQLTQFQVSGNGFSGELPGSLSMLSNLKRLQLSNNHFSGTLPELSRISGLTMFLAENNRFTGKIPEFDFSNLDQFNVSFNNFSGSIPFTARSFPASSFLGNAELCGDPLPTKCTLKLEYAEPKVDGSKKKDITRILMYSGYAVLGLVFIVLLIVWLCKRKTKVENVEARNKVAAIDESYSINNNSTIISNDFKTSRSEMSMYSAETSLVSSSLIILTSPVVNGLKFEDLLKAPAELLGRGKNGSLYKVVLNNRMTLVVKRIKNWTISSSDFMYRMWKIDRVKHPNVLPAVGFYSSKEEKLLVYEYQPNGSLFKFLHGNQNQRTFDWTTRVEVAASIAKALAFMHHELKEDDIAHGNLKSSNILLNRNMEPCISEYGLVEMGTQDFSFISNVTTGAGFSNSFREDVHGFGVILLELLTGKLVKNDGLDLSEWVQLVVREEWTAEVFDKSLISECVSEERMLNLLQVAIKCVNNSPEARPGMNQVAAMINAIKEDEKRSMMEDRSIVEERSIIYA